MRSSHKKPIIEDEDEQEQIHQEQEQEQIHQEQEQEQTQQEQPKRKKGRPRGSNENIKKQAKSRKPPIGKKTKVKREITPIENKEDWLLVYKDIELNDEKNAPKMGFDKAIKASKRSSNKEIIKASDKPFGTRYWGRRIIASISYYIEGSDDKPRENQILKYGRLGVQEVTESGGQSVIKSTDGYFGIEFKNNKRWFNISKIINAYERGKVPVHLERSYPFISPVGGFYNVDYAGEEINSEGQTIIDVPLEVNDRQALRTFYIFKGQNGGPVQALLDTGAQRSQISSAVARTLDLYDGPYEKKDAGIIYVDGNQYGVYSTTVEIVVYLSELMKDDPYKRKVSPEHHIGETIEVVFPKDQNISSNVDLLIGRNALRKLGLRVYIE